VTPLGQNNLLEILARHKVPFVIVGGHAVSFHGHIRATQDLDVIWLRGTAAEAALVAALHEAHAQWISDEIDPATGLEKLVPVSAVYVASTRLMMLVTDFGFLDLFDFVPGLTDASVQEVFDQSIPSGDYRFVSLDWLKKMKRSANRPRDIDDLEQLG